MNYNNIVIMVGHENTPVGIVQCHMIYDLIKSNNIPIEKTLEIGLAFGRSSLAIMSATVDKPHIAIDPYQTDIFKNLGIYNIENNNIQMNRFTLVEEKSQFYLPLFSYEHKNTFGFVFIDGEHTFDNVFIDFYYTDILLYNGGIVVFDDICLKPIRQMREFILKNRKNYEEIPMDGKYNLCAFKKTKEYENLNPDEYEFF